MYYLSIFAGGSSLTFPRRAPRTGAADWVVSVTLCTVAFARRLSLCFRPRGGIQAGARSINQCLYIMSRLSSSLRAANELIADENRRCPCFSPVGDPMPAEPTKQPSGMDSQVMG